MKEEGKIQGKKAVEINKEQKKERKKRNKDRWKETRIKEENGKNMVAKLRENKKSQI